MNPIPIENRVRGGIDINQLAAGNIQPQSQGQYQQPQNAMQGQYQQPQNAMQGQYQQPQNAMQGQYQQPQNAMQGQYQQPQNAMQGQYQQPQNAMQGQYQQPQNPMQGQYQQPQRTTIRNAGQTGVVIKKGQKVALTAPNQGVLDLIEVGLGWDLAPGGQTYDLDVEAFLLGANGKVLGDEWFVFYNQRVSPDGAVICGEDNTTGMGNGDDEIVQVQLSRVHPEVAKIVFIVTINEALERGYNFSNVQNAYVRIVDKQSNQELIRFQLTDYYATVCSMVVGELYRYQGAWKFNAVGNGTAEDLTGLCISYGVNVIG